MRRKAFSVVTEIGFIVFLFYSNLLMGEFTRSGAGHAHGVFWALREVITLPNLAIAITAAFLGHMAFDFLRKRS